MSDNIIRIDSISQLHQQLGYDKPRHPLISVINVADIEIPEEYLGWKIITGLYSIALKDGNCGLEYGRKHFDFSEGVMVFTAPGQVTVASEVINQGDINGWMLYFHPDLIRPSHLGEIMDEYTFFNYETYEALHLSEEEEKRVEEVVDHIKAEYAQRIDNHSQRVLVSNLELLLNYCLRFYERQFNTRKSQHAGLLSRFEKELKAWFADEKNLEQGLPPIKVFADRLHLSAHYLSDLLKKESGRTAKDHINDFIIERAKDLLLGTDQSVSEIAYSLGFNYPHYFTRLFKSRTGITPVEYRSLN